MNKSSLANNYKRRNLSFKKGIGSFLYSSKGEKYLDFVQGIAVNSLGHANRYLYGKLKDQAKKLKGKVRNYSGLKAAFESELYIDGGVVKTRPKDSSKNSEKK